MTIDAIVMFVEVRLLTGSPKALTYSVPPEFEQHMLPGRLVKVPVKERDYTALVLGCMEHLASKPLFHIKAIKSVENFPHDTRYHAFVQALASWHLIDPLSLYKRLHHLLRSKPVEKQEDQLVDGVGPLAHQVMLTDEQQKAVDGIVPAVLAQHFAPFLLHGVTGSGKTEVYKQLIAQTLQQGKSVIFLLPEITLSVQFQALLQVCFPHIPVMSFHAATRQREKRALWQLLLANKPVIVVGVHLPILLPFAYLGLIIVDEEHDPGYMEKQYPRLQTKQVALMRAQKYGIPIILGSATPSLNALWQVQQKKWNVFRLTRRFGGAPPVVKVVPLLRTLKADSRFFWITRMLADALRACLNRGEQAIIYLNRRGYSFFVQCCACSFIFTCPDCSVSLTLHRNGDEELRCHYCSYRQPLARTCPACQASSRSFLKKGIGTQQVVDMLAQLFPAARIARADLDVTSRQSLWAQTLASFKEGTTDILVGTQTITKGYHFPRVTLVGVLWADASVHFPRFDAAEISLAQLIQVAGRAGRATQESLVIIQVLHEHPIFAHISEQHYEKFAEEELEMRKLAHYPPFCRLAQLEVVSTDEQQVERESTLLAELMTAFLDKHGMQATVLGPSRPVVHKVQKQHRRHIFIKASSYNLFGQVLTSIDISLLQSSLQVTFL